MSVEEINAHAAKFETLNFGDEVAVLLWFKTMLELCGKERRRMPNGEAIANKVAQIYNVTPEAQRAGKCPSDLEGCYDWLFGLSLKAIRIKFDDFYLYYSIAASLIEYVLDRMPKTE